VGRELLAWPDMALLQAAAVQSRRLVVMESLAASKAEIQKENCGFPSKKGRLIFSSLLCSGSDRERLQRFVAEDADSAQTFRDLLFFPS